jgi:phage terminase large subunit
MLHSRHEDNPRLFFRTGSLTKQGTAYIKGILDKLIGVRYQRLRLGNWAAAEGLIYENWDNAVNLIDPFEVPQTWERWWAVDFGYTNPMVVQMWAEDPDGRLYLYREFYHTRTLVRDMAHQVLRAVTDGDGMWTEPVPMSIICDHDAEDRATFEDALEMATYPANKAVSPGLQAVQDRIAVCGDGKPRLFIMRDARVMKDADLDARKLPTCTADELPAYVWDTSGKKQTKEAPLKNDDHGCDAMRYVVAEHDIGGRPRLRSF